jgi:hypothetical protein
LDAATATSVATAPTVAAVTALRRHGPTYPAGDNPPMLEEMNLVDELHAIAAAFVAAGIPYAVCGGVAVTAHGATRSTKDIDILVHARDLPQVLELIRPLGYTFPALPMTFDSGTERERLVQRVSKIVGREHLLLDLRVAEGALAGTLEDRIEVVLSQGPLTIVSRATLIRMKRLAGRAQDLADLEKLKASDDG